MDNTIKTNYQKYKINDIVEELLNKKYLNVTENNKKFIVIKVIDNTTFNLFFVYSMYFYLLRKENNYKKMWIGMDFEYSNHKIKLWQIAFFAKTKELMQTKRHYVYWQSKSLDHMDIFIETLFLSPITKIVHGAEGLDIPYIFNDLLKQDKQKFTKFVMNLVDTRFLCEYIKVTYSDKNTKCSLYTALHYFDVINDKKLKDFDILTHDIGPIYKVDWNIKNLSDDLFKYAFYDVLYLKMLEYQIKKTNKKLTYLLLLK